MTDQTSIPKPGGGGDAVSVTNFPATQPISAAALPLPTGAATEVSAAAILAAVTSLLAAYKPEDSAHVSGDLGLPFLALRQSTDTVSTSADGDYANLKTDEEGRLKVASKQASFDTVSGSLTTVAQTLSCDVSRASNITLHVKNTGSATLAAGSFAVEGSVDSTNGTDGTWFGIQVARSNANTAEVSIVPSGMAAGAGYSTAWECSVNGYKWVRVRCTFAVTVNSIATWTIQRGSYATEPNPIIQVTGTQPVSGTVTANIGTLPAPATPYFLNSAATTNGALIITGGSTLTSFYATNEGASPAYVKLYNKATAPTVGTDVPEMTFPIPAAAAGVPGVANPNIGFIGLRFALGLGIAVTRNAVHTDTTAVGAGEVKVKLSRIA